MNDLSEHKIEYLLAQLEDDDLGVNISLQHLSGQELLKQPRRNYTHIRPSRVNTPRVFRMAAIGTIMVSGAAFVTATVLPAILYVIPIYLGYIALIFGIRQVRLVG